MGKSKLFLAAAAICMAAALCIPPGAAFAQGESGIKIISIQVLGNKNIDSGAIIDLLTIKSGDYIGSNALSILEKNADILEKTGWFRERPTLSYEGYEDGAILVVEVSEWPLYKEIRFTGTSLYTSDQLAQALTDYVNGRAEEVRKEKQAALDKEQKRLEKERKKKEKEEAKKQKGGAETAPATPAAGESEEPAKPAEDTTTSTETAPATAEAAAASTETAPATEPAQEPAAGTGPAIELPSAGETPVTQEELWGGNPPLIPGKVISMKTLEWALVNGVLGYYQKNGYIAAWVRDFSVGIEGDDEGVVTVEIGEGYVDEILVSGFKKTKERIIRREIKDVKVGEPLTKNAVQEDFRRLTNTGLFQEVKPDWEPSIKPGYIKMIFDVTEANTGQFGFGAGYSTVSGLQGTISYKENNLFGEAKSVSAETIFTQDAPGFRIEYRDPNVHGRDISFSARVFSLHTRQQRNPGTVKESELKLDTWGGSVGVGKQFTEKFSGSLALSVTENTYDVIKGDPFTGYSDIRRARLTQQGQTRSVTLTGFYDTRDNRFSTHAGNYAAVSAEIAGFGGDFDFRKYTEEYRYFIPFSRHTLAFRERVGFAEGALPLFEEFRLGGAYSLRGIAEDTLTGSKSVLINSEFRYAVDKKNTIVLALFSDMGWAGENFDNMDGEKSAGVGVHFQIPQLGFGAIRLDYGWQLGGDRNELLHFGIGEMF